MNDIGISNSQFMTLMIVIIAICIIVTILRSVVRMAMPVVVIGLVMVVFLGKSPEAVISKGKQFFSTLGEQFIPDQLIPNPKGDSFKNEDRGGNDFSEMLPGFPFLDEEEIKKFFDGEHDFIEKQEPAGDELNRL